MDISQSRASALWSCRTRSSRLFATQTLATVVAAAARAAVAEVVLLVAVYAACILWLKREQSAIRALFSERLFGRSLPALPDSWFISINGRETFHVIGFRCLFNLFRDIALFWTLTSANLMDIQSWLVGWLIKRVL